MRYDDVECDNRSEDCDVSDEDQSVEKIYARSGMTMTDVFNVVLQRSLTEDSMPVELSPAFHDSMRRAAMIMLTEEVDRRIEASRNERNLLSEEEVLQELGVLE